MPVTIVPNNTIVTIRQYIQNILIAEGTTTVVQLPTIRVATAGYQGPPGVTGPVGPVGAVGPPGPQGPSGASSYRTQVEPAGVKDGANLVFTFLEIPLEPTFELTQNGLLEDPSNYTLIGNTLTLTTPPKSWWRVAASYFV